MLYEFIDVNRDAIVARTREHVSRRGWPSISDAEIEYGVSLFLTQVSDTLRLESTSTPFPDDTIGAMARHHGAELLAAGFTVSQVVHDYGDICQAVTELAIEQNAPITVDEFHTLNRSLDTAIAEAVTEHTRLLAQNRSAEEVERLGHAAHELRDLLNGALLAFHALKRGAIPVSGSTGAVLGRSLTSLAALVDRTMSEVRLAGAQQRQERISIRTFVDDIASTALLHAEYRGLRLTVPTVDASLEVDADPQLLASAVMNLLHNAFKYTPSGGSVALRVEADGAQLLIGVDDECGGIPESKRDLFQAFGERRGADRSGLGLGLTIARQAVRAQGGDITVRNAPGHGCTFTINVPLPVHDVVLEPQL